MPSRGGTYECLCRFCTEGSAPGPDGKPRGKVLPLSQKAAHLARLAASNEALRQAAVVDAATEAFKSLSLIDNNHVPMSSVGGAPARSTQQARSVSLIRPPKSERSKYTKTAHAILDVVDQCIKACAAKLNESPSVETLDFAGDEAIRLQVLFNNVKRSVGSITARKDGIGHELSKLHEQVSKLRELHPNKEKTLEYDSSKSLYSLGALTRINPYRVGDHFNFTVDSYHPLAQIAMFIVVVGFVMMSLSRRMSELLLGLVSISVAWSFNSGPKDLKSLSDYVLKQIPQTLETVLMKFGLDGKTTIFAVCPKCHYTYAPTFPPGSDEPVYPECCSNHPLPDSDVCNAKLLSGKVPLKTFVYPHFHDYVAGLLSRSDLENMIDRSCDDVMNSLRNGETIHQVSDVFDAKFIRDFKGPDTTCLFVDRPDAEARLLFAFNFDFFAVEGMKLRGATASCGILSVACLNLPLSIRYKPEYMYICIIPGPDEPHLTEVNHYIRPFVDDLLVSWERGVRYSQTANYPQGRMTRSAAILGICDLPAARKISQLAGHSSSHYCSRCHCYHQSTINRTDIDSFDWLLKERSEVLKQAELWKAAPSAKEQVTYFTLYGTRWSELWRLPYWEPSRTLCVDVMHCGFEGCVQHHFRDVLGLTQAKAEEKAEMVTSFDYDFKKPDEAYITKEKLDPEDLKDIAAIHKLLVSPRQGLEGDDDIEENLGRLTASLSRRRWKALAFVSDSVGARPAVPPIFTSRRYTKDHYAGGLTNWVCFLFLCLIPSAKLCPSASFFSTSSRLYCLEICHCSSHESYQRRYTRY